MRGHGVLVAGILALCVATVDAQPAKPEPLAKEVEIQKAISAGWEKLATWCVPKKLREEARGAADLALELDPANAKAKAAKEAADKPGAEATEADLKEYAKKLETTRKQAAGLWKQAATLPHEDKDASKYDVWWGRALELDSKAIQPIHEAEVRAATGKSDWSRVARLLAQQEAALGTDPARAKALRDAEARVSINGAILRKASTHELRYFLSLPPAWTPDKTWPILVVCEGAGGSYEAQCNRFRGYRKEVPVILLAPCTFANSGGVKKDKHPWYPQSVFDEIDKGNPIEFDDTGLMAALADVRRDFGGEEKFFIAGYSGGGILTWWNIFSRPAELRGAFPACANYGGGPRTAPEGGRDVPIRAFQGDADGHLEMLTASWNSAEARLKEWGYSDFSRTLLQGVGHTACHEPIFKEIDAILKKK